MELDFLAVVVFDAVRAPASRAKADAQEEEEGRCGWDPYPITRAKAANLVCVWVDPFLSGLTCTRCGEPVVGASSTTVVFRVCGRLAPLEPCITQRIVAAWGPPGGTRAVCNSVKLHFFHQTQRIMGEVGYEFLYSSAFPLGLLLLPPPPSPRAAPTPVPPASPPSAPTPLALGGVYGLFNYNHDTSSADPIAGLWLIITSVRPPHGGLPPPLLLPPPPPPLLLPAATTPLTTPPLAVYALQGAWPIEHVRRRHALYFYFLTHLRMASAGPALDEHQRTIVVSNFLVAAIRAISPDFVSCFLNPRTIGRDFQSTCLFQDLPALHDAGPNTCLPPTVAAYGLCGALLCAGRLSPRQFVDGLMARVLRGEAEAEERDLFLRIVRDTLACFTLCGVEGLYWPDMSLGAPVEDQPFPLTFMPAERVFGKDDCEGRMAQILQVARLLQQMHACAKRIGVPAFVATVRATRSGTTLLGGLDAAVVHDLVRAACALGGLFEQGVLDAQITVGDGHLGSVPGGTMVGDALTGHSFGLLFLRPPTTTTTHDDDHGRQYAMHVLEGTGWQRRFNPQFDQPLDAAEEAAYAQIHPALEAFWARTGICKGVFCYRMDEPQVHTRTLSLSLSHPLPLGSPLSLRLVVVAGELLLQAPSIWARQHVFFNGARPPRLWRANRARAHGHAAPRYRRQRRWRSALLSYRHARPPRGAGRWGVEVAAPQWSAAYGGPVRRDATKSGDPAALSAPSTQTGGGV
jgi:hypothetical protein